MTPAPSAGGGPLAAYAAGEANTAGRQYPDPDADHWSVYQLDRNRVVHCAAFRRLQYKTQVFVNDVADHFRTRLTHTLEVAQLARRLATALQVNGDLAETIALAHDLGHPPFGHGGESALHERMMPHGGFEHNQQGLRVVEYLEHPYPAFRGLNLSYEVREGMAKHSGPYDVPRIENYRSGESPTMESQVADLADVIAYNSHDLEDGLGAGIISETELRGLLLWADAAQPVRRQFPDANIHAIRRPIIEAVQLRLIEDVVAHTRQRIAEVAITSLEDVRRAPRVVGFSTTFAAAVRQVESFLRNRLYRHRRVVRMDTAAVRTVQGVFDAYVQEPELMPDRYVRRIDELGLHRVVCDYVAGMTDRYCRDEHAKLRGYPSAI